MPWTLGKKRVSLKLAMIPFQGSVNSFSGVTLDPQRVPGLDCAGYWAKERIHFHNIPKKRKDLPFGRSFLFYADPYDSNSFTWLSRSTVSTVL